MQDYQLSSQDKERLLFSRFFYENEGAFKQSLDYVSAYSLKPLEGEITKASSVFHESFDALLNYVCELHGQKNIQYRRVAIDRILKSAVGTVPMNCSVGACTALKYLCLALVADVSHARTFAMHLSSTDIQEASPPGAFLRFILGLVTDDHDLMDEGAATLSSFASLPIDGLSLKQIQILSEAAYSVRYLDTERFNACQTAWEQLMTRHIADRIAAGDLDEPKDKALGEGSTMLKPANAGDTRPLHVQDFLSLEMMALARHMKRQGFSCITITPFIQGA